MTSLGINIRLVYINSLLSVLSVICYYEHFELELIRIMYYAL